MKNSNILEFPSSRVNHNKLSSPNTKTYSFKEAQKDKEQRDAFMARMPELRALEKNNFYL